MSAPDRGGRAHRSLFAMVRLNHGVVTATIDDRSRTFSGVGTQIWRLSDGSRTAPEIAEQIGAQYGIPPVEVLPDVVDFIDELAADGFMTWKR
jgi:hypothetical protein